MRTLHRGITASRDACVVSPFAAANAAHRKQWIQERLEHLRDFFSIECAGFVVMDNHMHLLLRLDSRVSRVSGRVRRLRGGGSSCFLCDRDGKALAVTDARIERFAGKPEWVSKIRSTARRSGLVYEVLEGTDRQASESRRPRTGAFWEGRYKSIAVLDEASLLRRPHIST